MALGVLFDIDGTLVTFEFDVEGTRKALLDELAKEGFDTSGLSMSSPTQYVMDSVRSQIASGRVSIDYHGFRRKLYSILDEFELDSCENAVAFPDAASTLGLLHSKSVKLAVLTNGGRRAASRVLGRAGLLDYFEFVLTREDVDAMKPNPEGVNLAVSMFSLPKDHVFYVGDSLYDIMAAKKAGLRVISVATGNYTAERLRSEGSDEVIDSLRSLPRVLAL